MDRDGKGVYVVNHSFKKQPPLPSTFCLLAFFPQSHPCPPEVLPDTSQAVFNMQENKLDVLFRRADGEGKPREYGSATREQLLLID